MKYTKYYIKDYPRPNFVRNDWKSLNGKWKFFLDYDNIGDENNFKNGFNSDLDILVPYSYTCKKSGVDIQKQCDTVWYSTIISKKENKQNILNFEASDYKTTVYINGQLVGNHEGGYTRFSFDITSYLTQKDNLLVVKVNDTFSCHQPRGKQRWLKESFGSKYVQTTGIWKTVWLEYRNINYLDRLNISVDIDNCCVNFEGKIACNNYDNVRLSILITYEDLVIAKNDYKITNEVFRQGVNFSYPHLDFNVKYWANGWPNLYDVKYELFVDDKLVDEVGAYFGAVNYDISKDMIIQNGLYFYSKMVLDQGYFNESGLTPKSEDEIINDIMIVKQMGYNGIRKHQKIEDDRFYYFCDLLGVTVWLEMPAAYDFSKQMMDCFTKEWTNIVIDHMNYPCIMAYVPFNESWGVMNIYNNKEMQDFTLGIYYLTKSLDKNKFVISNDGWEHTKSDIITLHNYLPYGKDLADIYDNMDDLLEGKYHKSPTVKQPFAQGFGYEGQPIMISEYGGIAFNKDKDAGWGYGEMVDNEQIFLDRYDSLTTYIKNNKRVCGFCFTQLTDVYQEVNGLLTFDRKCKVPIEKLAQINNK